MSASSPDSRGRRDPRSTMLTNVLPGRAALPAVLLTRSTGRYGNRPGRIASAVAVIGHPSPRGWAVGRARVVASRPRPTGLGGTPITRAARADGSTGILEVFQKGGTAGRATGFPSDAQVAQEST